MLNVDTIDNGTVIDHIRSGKGRKVLDLLSVADDYQYRVALVMNVTSKKLGKKDIVKIEGKAVSDKVANMICLISPDSTINQIENGKVVNKYTVKMPSSLSGVGKCPNPNCITNTESNVKTNFNKKDSHLFCTFCERLFKAEELAK